MEGCIMTTPNILSVNLTPDNSENVVREFSSSEFGTVRVVLVNGDPWFVGKDAAEILGYGNTRDAIARHVDEEDRISVAIHDGIKGNPNSVVINESGLYSLILSSKLASARKFKRWVTSEVLPAIRKTGNYRLPQTYREALKELLSAVEEKERLSLENSAMKPKAEFYDTVTGSSDTCSMQDAAKILNFPRVGRNRLFEILRTEKVLDRNNTPFQKYVDAGYFRVIESKWEDPNGDVHVFLKTVVYQKGLDFIRRVITCGGYDSDSALRKNYVAGIKAKYRNGVPDGETEKMSDSELFGALYGSREEA